MSPNRKAALGLLSEFPNAATMTLAKTAYKRWPELWPTLDAARSEFRRLRGVHGEGDRRKVAQKQHFREPRKPGDPFAKLPQPREMLNKWDVVTIPGPARVLCLADVHIPYHDTAALRAALGYGVEHKANLILLNGDIADFFSLSRWETDPRERDFPAELADMRTFLATVRELFPVARVVYKLGNHEERWLRYMQLKAPELLGIGDFELGAVLGLDALKIELVQNCCPIRIGPINVIHGHEYRFAISNPVNPARGLFQRGKVHAICGHFHQSSQHSEKNLEQHVVSTWSTGCLCDLHPEYRPLNNWNHGFAFVDVCGGAFNVRNLRIVDGKVWE